jgi:hypothetical protein
MKKSKEQYEQLLSYAKAYCESRYDKIVELYESYGDRFLTAPASSIEYYHNAFPGGYVDHVLRVVEFSLKLYDFYEQNGISVKGFTQENLVFVALHHDLGKLGFPGNGRERYIPNDSQWHVKNQGKVYKPNDKIPFVLVQHLSLYILQKHGIELNLEEYLGILIHDGVYDDINKPYFISNQESTALRSNLPYIIHSADLMASKHEFRTWQEHKYPKPVQNVEQDSSDTEKSGVTDNSIEDFFKKAFTN